MAGRRIRRCDVHVFVVMDGAGSGGSVSGSGSISKLFGQMMQSDYCSLLFVGASGEASIDMSTGVV